MLTGLAVAEPEAAKPRSNGAPVPQAAAKPRPKLDPVKDFITEFRFKLDPTATLEPVRASGSQTRLPIRPVKPSALRPGDLNLKAIAAVLEKRLPILSLGAGEVEVISPDDLRVRVPYSRMLPGALRQFTRMGNLEVRWLEDVNTSLTPGRYYIDTLNVNGEYTLRFRDRKSNMVISARDFAARCPLLAGAEDLEPDSAQRLGSGVRMGVRVKLNARASKRLREFQRKPGRMAAVLLDGAVMSMNAVTEKYRAPKRQRGEPREEEGLNEIDVMAGFGTAEEAGYLANVLNSGPLPYPLKLVSQGLMGGKTAPSEDDEDPLPDPSGT